MGCGGNCRPGGKNRNTRASTLTTATAELSMGWVDPWVGLGWVGLGRDFSVFGGLGWVGSTTAKVQKFERIILMHLKHG